MSRQSSSGVRGKSVDTLNSILSFLAEFEKSENVDLSSASSGARPAGEAVQATGPALPQQLSATGTTVLNDLLRFSLDSEPRGDFASTTDASSSAELHPTGRLPRPSGPPLPAASHDGISAISARMRSARVQLQEKQAEIEVLRGQVAERDKRNAELDGSAVREATALRAENERTIARHLETISRLVADKGKLTQKIASLLRGFEQVEAKYQERVANLRARYDAEFSGKRDVLRQQERVRRQQWEKAKVEEIREITVQGLQPEIQRLLEAHKTELRQRDQKAEDCVGAVRRQLAQVRRSGRVLCCRRRPGWRVNVSTGACRWPGPPRLVSRQRARPGARRAERRYKP
jgi:hypothetical protein